MCEVAEQVAIARVRSTGATIAEAQQAAAAAWVRHVAALHAMGWSYKRLGAEFGITPQRVQHLYRFPPQARRGSAVRLRDELAKCRGVP